ncbi:hypothetical protein [Pseudomonas sp. NyZ201]|uniref:hypothetical protein n=1 Tax=Pseudomonas sp. NyZ201 TaxID=3409857 RepID=UPI003CEFD420
MVRRIGVGILTKFVGQEENARGYYLRVFLVCNHFIGGRYAVNPDDPDRKSPTAEGLQPEHQTGEGSALIALKETKFPMGNRFVPACHAASAPTNTFVFNRLP